MTDAQVDALAASLGEDLDSSFQVRFHSDVTWEINRAPFSPAIRDPDDDTIARAPAAPRFNQATAAGVSAVADVLSLEALANVAQEGTLVRIAYDVLIGNTQLATERVADATAWCRDWLIAGVSLMSDPTDPTNARC